MTTHRMGVLLLFVNHDTFNTMKHTDKTYGPIRRTLRFIRRNAQRQVDVGPLSGDEWLSILGGVLFLSFAVAIANKNIEALIPAVFVLALFWVLNTGDGDDYNY